MKMLVCTFLFTINVANATLLVSDRSLCSRRGRFEIRPIWGVLKKPGCRICSSMVVRRKGYGLAAAYRAGHSLQRRWPCAEPP